MSKESALASIKEVTQSPGVVAADPAPETPELPGNIPLPDAARFAAIARKEAEFVRKQEEFKARQKEFEEKNKRAEHILKRAQEFEDLSSKDKVGALRSLGWSDTDIFNLLASAQPPKEVTPEEKTAELITKTVEDRLKEEEKKRVERETKEQAEKDVAIIAEMKGGMTKFLDANKETYEYCAYMGAEAEALAYEIIIEGLRDSGGKDLIDVKEAFELAEQFYEEKDEGMSTLKKRQAKAPVQEPQKSAAPERTRTVTAGDPTYKHAEVIQRTRTLSGSPRATSASLINKSETHEQKKERLIALIKNQGLRK